MLMLNAEMLFSDGIMAIVPDKNARSLMLILTLLSVASTDLLVSTWQNMSLNCVCESKLVCQVNL